MKVLIAALFVSTVAQAQIPSVASATGMIKDKGQKILLACKDDRKNIKGCEKYTEVAPLKECLVKNKEALSAGCKKSITE